ncbi:hypothetical protein [Arcobacter sp. FWKO B]|uniref:hypothetical protein n=1 Tax=Arcobacter sp. FWKO B TaxID=2593672 RepID=UPI0018A3DFC8|nr:hypothetical protein [Arcobacter sp. FWKO B]QOG12032.1 hypothetical protein FWKOB_04630 [Arcobacter sp. FWKO B]
MNLLLVTKEVIIEKIFTLVCNKLDIKLDVKSDTQITQKYDIIVLDTDFIDDRFNIIKQYTKKLGAISAYELSFDKSKDFVINRPFLPTQLFTILQTQIFNIQQDEKKVNKARIIQDFETENTIHYLDSLVDDIASDIEQECDESIIPKPTIKNGGVLDSLELSKIKSLLDPKPTSQATTIDELDEDDWLDLSEIIDKALEEVKEYQFKENKPIKLVLSQYNITELKPLFERLNQDVVDALADGKEINLILKLKD